jgi:hypothetical protein
MKKALYLTLIILFPSLCACNQTPITRSSPTSTVDACAGASAAGAREQFTLEQIAPCLDTIDKVNTFMANNITYDVQYDTRERGGNEYVPATTVYSRGIDDGDGYAILACYLLEQNGYDAVMFGLSIDTPIGSNVCAVNYVKGITVFEGGGILAGPFSSVSEMVNHYIEIGWMQAGGNVQIIKASQITQATTDTTTPNVLDLPWEAYPY